MQAPTDDQQLQERMTQVRKQLKDGKWNEAAIEMNEIKNSALLYYSNNQLAFEMAQFYYMLGNVLVCKIENTQDLFGDQVKQVESDEKNQDDVSESEDLNSQSQEEQQEPEIHDENVEQAKETKKIDTQQQLIVMLIKRKEELDGDFQLAWENLAIAQLILERELEVEKDSTKQLSLNRHLARVHLRRAELEQWRDNFDVSLEEHKKALELRKLFEDATMSRDLAESYFLLGNGCEIEAMENYKQALQILENNLSKELKLPMKDVSNIDEQAPLTYHLNASFLDTPSITELKAIVKLIYEKIEDLKIGIKESQSEEFKKVQAEFEQMKQANQAFPQQTTQSKPVISLGNFGNAAKKNLQDSNQIIAQQQKDNDNSVKQIKDDEVDGYKISPKKIIKDD